MLRQARINAPSALHHIGEEHARRARLRSAGMDLAMVIEAVCRHLRVDESELAGPTRRAAIARARALIASMANRDLSIHRSEWPAD